MESKETTQQTKKQHTRTHTPVDGYKIEELRLQDLDSLVAIAEEVGVQNPREFRRQELVFEILKAQTKQGGFILFTGILEIVEGGYGFLRSTDANLSDSANVNEYMHKQEILKDLETLEFHEDVK